MPFDQRRFFLTRFSGLGTTGVAEYMSLTGAAALALGTFLFHMPAGDTHSSSSVVFSDTVRSKLSPQPYHSFPGRLHRRGTTVSVFVETSLLSLMPLPSVCDSAKNALHSNPENTVFGAKRLIGCCRMTMISRKT